MAKTFSGKQVADILVRDFDFQVTSQKGSHMKLKKKVLRGEIVTVVPLHRELAIGTLRGVLNLAQVDYKEFLKKAR